MDGLKTTRVLVLDDKIKEVKPFMEALARRSIGSIYFSGTDEEKLPPKCSRLTGIRLAALDLDLGVSGDARTVIGTLLNVVNKLIDRDNGPYLAIVWTSRDDTYFEEFLERREQLKCPPIDIIKMGKADYPDSQDSTEQLDAIFEAVATSVERAYPLGLLSYWEQIVHDSSGSVMRMLPSSTGWQDESRKTLQLILQHSSAEGDSSVGKLAALLSTFNSLQLDSIESKIASLNDAASYVSPLDGSEPPEELELVAKLNRRLLCPDASEGIAPGNIYRCEKIHSGEATSFPTLDELLDDLVRSRPNPDEEEREKQLEREEQKLDELKAAGIVAIAMEVTPLCDYQQDNTRLARFVCGVALPYDERRKAKRPQGFLRTDNAPIEFEDGELAGRKLLVWNSRFMVSAREDQIRSEAKLFRLRQAPLIDVQAWLASQINRPGVFSIRTGW